MSADKLMKTLNKKQMADMQAKEDKMLADVKSGKGTPYVKGQSKMGDKLMEVMSNPAKSSAKDATRSGRKVSLKDMASVRAAMSKNPKAQEALKTFRDSNSLGGTKVTADEERMIRSMFGNASTVIGDIKRVYLSKSR
jgi:hypothetical protein